MKKAIRNFLYKYGYKDSCLQRIHIFFSAPLIKASRKRKSQMVNCMGNNILAMVLNICKETGILIWPEFGTLLGAFRDKSFISFDPDIDLGILSKDFSDELLNRFYKNGCSLKRKLYLINSITHEQKLIELTLEYKGLCFDIFLSDVENDNKRKVYVSYQKLDEIHNTYKCKYYTVKYDSSCRLELRINDIRLLYPADPEEYLRMVYGETFMTPIKEWIPPTNNPIITFIDPEYFFVQEVKE